jgi:hypothetical protein
MSGAPGHTGHTGITGRRGLQGTPYGAPGTTFYSTSGRVTTSTKLSDFTVSTSEYGINYLMTGTSNITVTLPSVIDIGDYGAFWTFRNNYSASKTLTLANTAGVVYSGNSAATSVTIASSNALTLVFSGGSNTTSTYIAI